MTFSKHNKIFVLRFPLFYAIKLNQKNWLAYNSFKDKETLENVLICFKIKEYTFDRIYAKMHKTRTFYIASDILNISYNLNLF